MQILCVEPVLTYEIRYDDARCVGESFRTDACTTTEEGWMRVDAVIGRGDVVLPYRRADGSVRWEFRPASEVTDQESLDSFEALPVTNEHPPRHLDSASVRSYRVGQSGTPRADGALVRSRLVIDDPSAMADVRSGKRQISPGYRVVLDETPGIFGGRRYDAVQRRIRGNHIAIVPMGRQGPEVALRMDCADAVLAFDMIDDLPEAEMATKTDNNDPKSDAAGGQKPADNMDALLAAIAAKLARVDELASKVDEMGSLIEALNAKPKAEECDSSMPKADDAGDGSEPKMDAATRARIDQLEDLVKRSDAELKALRDSHRADMAEAEKRADVLATAKRICGDDYSGAGKSRLDIMADVVCKVDGAEAKASIDAERSDAAFDGYLRARYQGALAEFAKRSDSSQALLDAAKRVSKDDESGDREDAAAKAKAEMEKRAAGRWRQGATVK